MTPQNPKKHVKRTILNKITSLKCCECFSILFFVGLILTLCYWSESIDCFMVVDPETEPPQQTVIKSIALSLTGSIVFILILWCWNKHGRKATNSNKSSTSEQIEKATSLLSDKDVSNRIAGINMFWQVARNSKYEIDKRKILDMLCAFIRSPEMGPDLSDTEDISITGILSDVQIAVSLLTQKIKELKLKRDYRADLTGANLQGVILMDADLSNTILEDVNLTDAILIDITFTCETFTNTRLTLQQCKELGILNHKWIVE